MKNTRTLLSLLIAATLAGFVETAHSANTDGSVTFSTTTQNYNGSYDPNHVAVVWVVDGNGTFVKTLCRHASARIQYLYKWIASRGSYTVVDGVTSATLAAQPQTHNVTWDCRGTNGLVVADGVYSLRAEYTSSNAQGPYMASQCQFVKGSVAVSTNFPNYSNAAGQFTGLSLSYTPKADVAITALSPGTGIINSNVAIQVTVNNLTLNPATFSVSVSNVTSGTLIGTYPVTALAGSASANLNVTWNTAGLTSGAYSIRAIASGLANETATANNLFTRVITLSSATAGDLSITALSPSVGVIDTLVPVTVTIENAVSEATGPFLVALTNLTGGTLTNHSNTWSVATANDDAEENGSTHAVNLTSSDLELVYDANNQIVGIRFQNVAIPPGAPITSAAIQFSGKTDDTLNINPISLTIKGQAADNAAIFTSTAYSISTRPETSAAVAWSPPEWTNGDVSDNARTPDLKAIVQEVVNRPGWTSGNALVFKVTGTGGRRAYSYNGVSPAARLIVQWTTESPLIATQMVYNVAAGARTNVVLYWNTAGLTGGVYQVKAVAGPLATETHVSDNTLTSGIALREPINDLTVQTVAITPMVPPNVSTNITVTVINMGDVTESFTHTLRDLTATPGIIGSTAVNNLPAYASTNLTYSWNTTTNAGFALGYHTLQADVTVVSGETNTADNTNAVQVIVANGMTTNTLVAKDAIWNVYDKGLDLSSAPWQLETYYDGFWETGAAPLGYNLPNIATAIGYGGVSSNRYVTTYFRRAFNLDFQPWSLAGRVMRAHGVVLYLNGTEIARQNMPAGPIGYGTLASAAVLGASATNLFEFVVPPSALALGRNLLTAELHVSSVTDTTAGFALELTSVNPAIPLIPSVAVTAVEPEGTVQSGDTLGVFIELVNNGNTATSCQVLLKDTLTGAVLALQNVPTLVPGESTFVRLTWPTFGATTGAGSLQAVTVINGVTNLTDIATAPVTLDAPNFAARSVQSEGSIGGRCNAVAVSGNTVFLGCGATLEAWNVTTPLTPVRVGAVRLPGIIEDLAASNAWVYAATGVAGVQIVDVSSSTQLIHRATFDSSGFARRITLAGNLLYVADGLGGVRVLNVTLPAAPSLAGAYQTTGPAQTVTLAGSRLLVLDGHHGLQNLNAANPAALAVTGTLSRVTAGLALTAVPGAALVADANAWLFRIDTSSPAMLAVTTNTLLPSAGRGLATSAAGTALYVAAGPAGVLTLDATTLAVSATTEIAGEASAVAVAGNTLYVAAGFAGCRSFSISSPFSPQALGSFSTGARPVDATAVGSKLFVAADESGFQVHSLENPALPDLLANVSSVNNARCVEVAYPLAYVGDGLFGLKIFNIANASAPVLVGNYPASGLSHIRRIALSGTRAVLTDGRVLQLLSVANPVTPSLLVTVTNTPGSFIFDLAVVGNQAYAACGNAGLRIYGLGSNLSLDGTYATPGPATGVASTSNLLHLACGPYGWLTLSLATDPANPVLVKSSANGMSFGVVAAGPLVYLTDGTRVGRAMNVSAPLTPTAVTHFPNLTQALRVRAASGFILMAEDEAGLAILNASPSDINLSGIPDAWEQQIVAASTATNGPTRSVLDVDPQAVGPNGYPYYQSYLAGLSPIDPNSVLAISSAMPTTVGGQFVVQWQSVPGIKYVVYKSTNLTDIAAGFLPASPVITATADLTSYTNAVTTDNAFYMILTSP